MVGAGFQTSSRFLLTHIFQHYETYFTTKYSTTLHVGILGHLNNTDANELRPLAFLGRNARSKEKYTTSFSQTEIMGLHDLTLSQLSGSDSGSQYSLSTNISTYIEWKPGDKSSGNHSFPVDWWRRIRSLVPKSYVKIMFVRWGVPPPTVGLSHQLQQSPKQ